MTAHQQYDTDVVIVGYGPSGVSAANFLGSRGVQTIAVERAKDIYSRARAVTVNDWTMRIFQSVGLAEPLLKVMDETHSLRWVTYDGQVINRVSFPPGEMGFARSYSIYQPIMEQVLRDGAARYGEHLTVRYGEEVADLSQDGDGVTVKIRDVGSGTTSTIRARYALACDGGSSMVREKLGIPLLGDTLDVQWVIIDAMVKRWWPNRHILTFWSDKQRPAVDISLALGTHRWELPLAPHESERDFETHAQLWPLLKSMGVSENDVEIHQHAFYRHHIRTAERWRDGRVFLLGDAAHLMPPWAGQGMQSGIRDAANLSWKLADVLAGNLPDSVLDSYHVERAPDVERYTRISVGLGRIIKQELSDAEMAAMQAAAEDDDSPAPVLAYPVIAAGWIAPSDDIVGHLCPQPRIANARGIQGPLDDIIGDGFTLLADSIDPRELLGADERAGWDRLGARYRAVRTPDQRGQSDDDLVDIGGSLLGWMRHHGVRAVALRPDRFVAATDRSGLALPATAQQSTHPQATTAGHREYAEPT